jgi:hypothetical protein
MIKTLPEVSTFVPNFTVFGKKTPVNSESMGKKLIKTQLILQYF